MRLNPLALLFLYLAVSTVYVSFRGVRLNHAYVDSRSSDFAYFYDVGLQAQTSDRTLLYSTEPIVKRGTFDPHPAIGGFAYPPAMVMVLAGVSYFQEQPAKLVLSALNVLAVAAVLLLLMRWAKNRSEDLLFIVLAALSFWPLYSVAQIGHPTGILALLATLAFVAAESRPWWLAGAFGSLLVLKPSVGLLQMLLLLLHGRVRIAPTLVLGAVLFGLVPFAFMGGLSAIPDYIAVVREHSADGFRLTGNLSQAASLMFNWNGFFARLFARDPSHLAVYVCDALTLLLLARVWLKGNLTESWLAAALAVNMATPHIHYYDLLILLAPALALALRTRDPAIVFTLCVLHFAINASMFQLGTPGLAISGRHIIVIVATPAMFFTLSLLAFEGLRGWLRERLAHAPMVYREPAMTPEPA